MTRFRLSNEFAINRSTLRRLHWGRATVGGVCAELAVFAILFPVLHFFGQTAFLVSILVSSAVLPFLFAVWVDRHVESHFLLHGLLVGVVAVGGLLGGVTSARRQN